MPRRSERRGGGSGRRKLTFSAERPLVARLVLGLLTAAAVAAFLVDWTPRGGTAGLELGDIAAADIRAQSDLEIVDQELTEQKRLQARQRTPPLFEYDVLLSRNMLERVDRAFGEMQAFQKSEPSRVDPTPPEAPSEAPGDSDGADPEEDEGEQVARPSVDPASTEKALEAFQDTLGLQLSEVDLATLSAVGWSPEVQRDIKELVRVAMSDYIVLDGDRLPADGDITVQRIEGSERSEFTLSDFRSVVDRSQAQETISRTAQADFADRPQHVLTTIVNIARGLTVPNLRFNASETEVRRELAASAVAPITTTYRKGQIILRSGEPVTPWSLTVIERMTAESTGYHPVLHHLSATGLLFALLTLFVHFTSRFVAGFRHRFNDLLAMAALLLFVTAWAAVFAGVASGPLDAGSTVPSSAWGYAVPVAVGGILLRTLTNAVTGAAWSVLAGLSCAAILDGSLFLAVFLTASSLAGVGGLGGAHERGRLIRAGLVAALVNVIIVLGLDLMGLAAGTGVDPTDLTIPLAHVLFALLGGVASGVLAVGLAPLFEGLGFVTDSKLLELSNLNHPLLREMIVKAPGTYHHSMVVGSLAEAAAEAVGANSLLVRIGAYFHDIGKALKPQYFIENQRDVENIHDRLSPSMSALVIVSHVKEGIELGRRYKLPEPIIDMIPQHHGTSLVSFFYNKAKQQADPDKGEISESDYRYPGPKPQTKEAAIMMLADGVEAATRSLKSHTQGAITARVEKIVNKCVVDGQLDECPLTLRDLHVASETFVQVLMGIHHHRIEYPNPPGAKGTKGRGLPASSITLELPPLTPNPDGPDALRLPSEAELRKDEPKGLPPEPKGLPPEPKGLPPAGEGAGKRDGE